MDEFLSDVVPMGKGFVRIRVKPTGIPWIGTIGVDGLGRSSEDPIHVWIHGAGAAAPTVSVEESADGVMWTPWNGDLRISA